MGEAVALAKSRRLLSRENVEFRTIELETPAPRRMATAVVASVVLHALALVALLSIPPPADEYTPVVAFPVSLVSIGGGGGEGGGTPEAAPSPPAPVPVVSPKVVKPSRPLRAEPRPSAAANTPAEGAAGGMPSPTGGGGTGAGGGGGGGLSGASPAYGVNPQPPYPMIARRLKLEGTVVLRVFVATDGTPKRVEVLTSSGHEALDASATDTVRTRWRFQPARRNGVPVEDSVQVPIRFRQTQG